MPNYRRKTTVRSCARARRYRGTSQGVSVVEFTLLITVITTLIMGGIEAWFSISRTHQLNKLSHLIARSAYRDIRSALDDAATLTDLSAVSEDSQAQELEGTIIGRINTLLATEGLSAEDFSIRLGVYSCRSEEYFSQSTEPDSQEVGGLGVFEADSVNSFVRDDDTEISIPDWVDPDVVEADPAPDERYVSEVPPLDEPPQAIPAQLANGECDPNESGSCYLTCGRIANASASDVVVRPVCFQWPEGDCDSDYAPFSADEAFAYASEHDLARESSLLSHNGVLVIVELDARRPLNFMGLFADSYRSRLVM